MSILRLFAFACASSALFASALAAPHDHDGHEHSVEKRLPTSWEHPAGHPAYALFRRDAATDGATYPEVGSSTWTSAYPASTPTAAAMPKAWAAALNASISSGKIPNIPSSSVASGFPTYPNGFDPNGNVVCSATYKCRNPGDIWDAPDGVFGSGFDDGPQPASDALYDFLQENDVHATHFMIGVNIVSYPDLFTKAFDNGDDIAVHTWTHPYMTTLSNEDVVAQLGYTMQIIHDSTGGRLPRYWRPPYGDSDNRVRAIASEVFGLETIIWNQDTEDWSIPQGTTTLQQVSANLQKWITGPKSPGLIILEHELYNVTVEAFVNAFPLIKQNGWQFIPVTSLNGSDPYQNAADNTAPVTPQSVGVLAAATSVATSAGSASASSSASSATSHATGAAPASSTGTSTTTSTAGTGSGLSAQRASNSASRGSIPTERSLMFVAIATVLFSSLALCS